MTIKAHLETSLIGKVGTPQPSPSLQILLRLRLRLCKRSSNSSRMLALPPNGTLLLLHDLLGTLRSAR